MNNDTLMTEQYEFILDGTKGSGSTSNFSIEIDLPHTNTCNRICLKQLFVPKTWYNIRNGFNSFILIEDGVETTITIPYGNYNITGFRAQLTTQLNNNSPHSFIYNLDMNDTSNYQRGLITFTCSNTTTPIQFVFSSNSLYKQMGFIPETYNFTSGILLSINIVRLQGVENLLLLCSGVSNKGQVLQEIFCSDNSNFSSITVKNQDETYAKIFNKNIGNSLTFVLVDEYDGSEIDLNGNNIVLSLIIYRDDTDHSKIIERNNYELYKLEQEHNMAIELRNEIKRKEIKSKTK